MGICLPGRQPNAIPFRRGRWKLAKLRLVQKELGTGISQSYLSQIESGARPHLTNSTRLLLAKFFKVHPGYLVDDPDEFHEALGSPVGGRAQTLSSWLRVGASRFRHDPVGETLARLAAHPERRKALRLLDEMLGRPVLIDRLLQALEVKRR